MIISHLSRTVVMLFQKSLFKLDLFLIARSNQCGEKWIVTNQRVSTMKLWLNKEMMMIWSVLNGTRSNQKLQRIYVCHLSKTRITTKAKGKICPKALLVLVEINHSNANVDGFLLKQKKILQLLHHLLVVRRPNVVNSFRIHSR